jgi:hypothetical protein
MANTSAITNSFKDEVLQGYHNFGTGPVRASGAADTFKASLYLVTASLDATTTAYTTAGEVTGTNYSAGGVLVTNATPPTHTGTTTYWTPSTAINYPNVLLQTAFDTVLIYNSSQNNRSVLVFKFGSTTASGTLTLNMPPNNPGQALLNVI